ncbi:MAG TPA: hydantoinase/oxoprolinase family protein [Acetobacteraceae bacterium]|nr:hydantoinase/oxoprolinase family protein [Acetobacteraceae bacterium]
MRDDGGVITRKAASTPDDYARGVVRGIRELMAAQGLPLSAIGDVLHGCTIATNTILERKGARTALITTRGFRDVLEFRRIRVPRLYDPLYVKPAPLVPRNLRLEVTERLDATGSVVQPLDEADVAGTIAVLEREAVEAVAVCFLHAYANAAHEQRVGDLLRARFPEMFVTLSSDILPEIREYERTSTAVINAYIGPIVSRYVRALDAALHDAGIDGRLLMMQSSGGILDAARVAEVPARIIECGPAAGVIGAMRQAGFCGERNVITLDMGGTTAKASLIENGAITRTDEYEVAGGISLSSRLVKGGGCALKLPVIDISEVGAGGGSIVWFDRGGALKVGPRSAGATPGPACYDAGGSEATVTDANVVLGFINPTALAGGTMPIRADLSHDITRTRVAEPLGLGLHEAAWSVHAVASANMMRAVKAVSTYRGRNPAEFSLMAFGGNGGIFAVELARQLQIRRIVVPPGAGVFSAIGLGLADIAFGRARAVLTRTDRIDAAALNTSLRTMETDVVGTLGSAEAQVRRTAMMRYAGQAFELSVPLPDHDLGLGDLAALPRAFDAEHERNYGHVLADAEGVEIIAVEVTATAVVAPMKPPWLPVTAASGQPDRHAFFGPEIGTCETPVVHRRNLDTQAAAGPIIIEEYEGTTIVPPDARVRLDAQDDIVIELAA